MGDIIKAGTGRVGGVPLDQLGAPRAGYARADAQTSGRELAAARQRLDAAWGAWGKSVEARALGMSLRLDAGETVFFLRELAEIKTKAFDIIYATLKGRQFVPVVPGDPGAETFVYAQFDYAGKAKRLQSGARDLPKVNAKGTQYVNPYSSYGVAFDYTIQELRAAQKAGRSIDQLRAKAARMAIAQLVDDVIANGDPDVDNGSGTVAPMRGLLSLCAAGMGTQSFVVPQVAGSSVWIGNKTADQIISDVNSMVAQVPSQTKDVEHVRRLILPVAQYQYISTTPRSTISDTTIRDFLEGSHRDAGEELEIVSWERLAAAGAGAVSPGTAPFDMMIGYDPNPDKVWCPISIEYEQMAPQLAGMQYDIFAETRLGGVVSPYPMSIIFGSGI